MREPVAPGRTAEPCQNPGRGDPGGDDSGSAGSSEGASSIGEFTDCIVDSTRSELQGR
jgi:hypothetical protein